MKNNVLKAIFCLFVVLAFLGCDNVPEPTLFEYERIGEFEYEFTASQPTNAEYWDWKFPGEQFWQRYQNTNRVTYDFSEVGDYQVMLETRDSNGELIGSFDEIISVTETYFDYERVVDLTYEFTASEPDDAQYWRWKFEGESYWYEYEEDNKITYEFPETGEYEVILEIQTASHVFIGSFTQTVTIAEDDPPEPDSENIENERIGELEYKFTAPSPDNAKFWEWKFPEEEHWFGHEDQNWITYTFDTAGEKTVYVEIYDNEDDLIWNGYIRFDAE